MAAPAFAAPVISKAPPPLYEARRVLRGISPDMAAFAKDVRPLITRANEMLLAAERERRGVGCTRQMLLELRWRINSTVDVAAARDNRERLEAALRDLASGQSRDTNVLPQDAEGSYGGCHREWFWKVESSGDQLLDTDGWRGRIPPRFLDGLNTPGALIAYLESIVTSDLARDKVDKRKELNLSTGLLVRMVLRGGSTGYFVGPEFKTALRAFLDLWQDPETGFFGEWYMDNGRLIKTADLSVTFHMARYTRGKIGHWPELIDTLLAIKDRPYPQGWLDDDGMTNHNNYDVAELFRLGWPHMREDQRRKASAEIARMLDWSLTHSIGPDGTIAPTTAGEPLGDMYYFAGAFLDCIGYFDKRKRFWTDADFPQAEPLRQALEAKARLIAPDAAFAHAALSRLAAPRPRDNVPAAERQKPVARLPARKPLLMSGFMDARPFLTHDVIERPAEGANLSHFGETMP